MSYKAHEAFTAPKDKNARIWRYTDLGQLISLLDTEALFFPRTNLFDDPFEGTVPKRTRERLAAMDAPARAQLPPPYKPAGDRLALGVREFNQLMCVSCWHISDHESAAMWKLYLSNNQGVAVQSTFGRLVHSLSSTPEDVYIGVVNYIDYDQDDLPGDYPLNPLHALMHKRHEFEHEKELRAVSSPFYESDLAGKPAGTYLSPLIRERTGIALPVDVARLVAAIHVAPSAPDWSTEVVEAVVKRFEYSIPVKKSQLYRPPDFSR